MGVLERTKSFFINLFSKKKSWEESDNLSLEDFLVLDEDRKKKYRGWQAVAMRAIAEEISTIEFKLYKKIEGQYQEVDEHPLLDLLYNPNPLFSKNQLFELISLHLDYYGKAFLRIVGKPPVYLFPWHPSQVRFSPVVEEGKPRWNFEVFKNGTWEKVEDGLIVPIFYIDLFKIYDGRAPIENINLSILNDYYASLWNYGFLKRASRPAGVLQVKEELNENKIKFLKKQWQDYYSGAENAHKTPVLPEGVEFKELEKSPRDMDFAVLKEKTREEILGGLRTSKTILGLSEDVNRATAETADYVFAKRVIKPRMEKIVDALNKFLVPLYEEDIYLDFESPVPEDEEMKLRKFENGIKNHYLTINEIREEIGLPPVSGGDQIYMPLNLVPVGKVEEKRLRVERIKRKVNALKREEKLENIAKEKIKAEFKNLILEEIKKAKQRIKNERYKAYWQEWVKKAESYEKKIKEQTKKYFEKQKKKILERLPKKGLGKIKSLELIEIDWIAEEKLYLEMIGPIFEEMIKEQGELASRELLGEVRFDSSNPAIKDFIDEYTLKLAKGINETTRKRLSDKIVGIMESGGGIDEIKLGIEEIYQDAVDWRAEMIARTESIRVSNFASKEAFRQCGIGKKKWLTAFDLNVCENCALMNGEVVPINERFSNGVDVPPAHPNCRCTILPVFERGLNENEIRAKVKVIDEKEIQKEIDKRIEEKIKKIEKEISQKITKEIEEALNEL